MSERQRLRSLGRLVDLQSREVDRLNADVAEKRATRERYLRNLARMEQLCQNSGPAEGSPVLALALQAAAAAASSVSSSASAPVVASAAAAEPIPSPSPSPSVPRSPFAIEPDDLKVRTSSVAAPFLHARSPLVFSAAAALFSCSAVVAAVVLLD